ncbi:MAG: hypothetical protein NZ805_10220 [Armatimonadetes bacterium]|nr:hypothetical protein [Armatimonadota bacterium]
MKRMKPAKRYSRRRLEKFVTEIVSLAKDLCPESEIRIKVPGYEELDAFIDVVVPDEMVEEVSDRLHARASQIFDEENYLIGIHVAERSLRQKPKQQAE